MLALVDFGNIKSFEETFVVSYTDKLLKFYVSKFELILFSFVAQMLWESILMYLMN